MKLKELENFIAVATTGSIRSAAKLRGLTPPALTQSIARLEEELHVPLVVRTTRGAVLSEYGTAFLHRARLITAEVDKASAEISQMLGQHAGRITIGASMTPATTVLPPALARFRRDRPDVRVNIVGGLYHAHLPLIRSGEMDFAIGPVPAEGLDADFAVEQLFVNDLVIAARATNPLARARTLTELSSSEWIVTGPSSQGPGAAIAEGFRRRGLTPPKAMIQCDSILTLYTLLMDTNMICALPRQLVNKEPFSHGVVAVDVPNALPHHAVSLFRRADSPLLPAAAYLATLLRRYAHYLTQEEPAYRPPAAEGEAAPETGDESGGDSAELAVTAEVEPTEPALAKPARKPASKPDTRAKPAATRRAKAASAAD